MKHWKNIINPDIRDNVFGEKRVKLPTCAVSAFTKCINREVVFRLFLVFLAGAVVVVAVFAMLSLTISMLSSEAGALSSEAGAVVVAVFASLSVVVTTSMDVISMLSAEAASASRSSLGKFKLNVLFFRYFRETTLSWCFSSPSTCASLMSWSLVPLWNNHFSDNFSNVL